MLCYLAAGFLKVCFQFFVFPYQIFHIDYYQIEKFIHFFFLVSSYGFCKFLIFNVSRCDHRYLRYLKYQNDPANDICPYLYCQHGQEQ